MNLSEYQDWATTTAVYPATHGDWKRNPFYVGLGLIGEAHEFEREMMKPPSDRQAKELSDVLWYASMLAWEFGKRNSCPTVSANESFLTGKICNHPYLDGSIIVTTVSTAVTVLATA